MSTIKKYLWVVNRFCFSKWFKKGIISIKDLLTESRNFLTFQEFSLKYSCQTNFLQYYQVISAVPKHLLSIAKQTNGFDKHFFISNDNIFPLSETVQINLGKAKSRDFYKLLKAGVNMNLSEILLSLKRG